MQSPINIRDRMNGIMDQFCLDGKSPTDPTGSNKCDPFREPTASAWVQMELQFQSVSVETH